MTGLHCNFKTKDEVKQFLDARYVGPPEAAWRLFAFPMHDKSHNVERLAVHLTGGETITFQSGQEREVVVVAAMTTLTDWFDLNAAELDCHGPQARPHPLRTDSGALCLEEERWQTAVPTMDVCCNSCHWPASRC